MDEPRLLSATAAAQYLGGIHRATIYRLINTGDLPTVKVGARTMLDRADLDAYIDLNKAVKQ